LAKETGSLRFDYLWQSAGFLLAWIGEVLLLLFEDVLVPNLSVAFLGRTAWHAETHPLIQEDASVLLRSTIA
jgi:hypothetical protein